MEAVPYAHIPIIYAYVTVVIFFANPIVNFSDQIDSKFLIFVLKNKNLYDIIFMSAIADKKEKVVMFLH